MKKTDDAVSPVVATILLVAIAVGLVAVIAAMAFGMVGNLEGGKMVSLTVDTQKSSNGNIIVTFAGGADLPALSGLRVTVNDVVADDVSVYTFPHLLERYSDIPRRYPATSEYSLSAFSEIMNRFSMTGQ